MLKQASTQDVLDETLVKKATGTELNRLSNLYGFNRPLYIKDQYWKSALNAVLFNARGTHGVIFSFLENLFKEWSEHTTYTFTGASSSTLSKVGIDCNYEGRLCKINGKVYYSTHRSGNTLYFSPVKTSYWNKADFTLNESYSVQLLPFTYREIAGEFKLVVDYGVFNVPSTYLNEDAEVQNANEPKGGIIYDFFSSTSTERTGLNPVYLGSDFFDSAFFSVCKQVLASGIKFSSETITWCDSVSSLYASITDLNKYNTTNPSSTNPVQPARS
tara:strand:+ start:8782 stop:9600 length:819 start_codon:yes stop_codon:yes gene_type:complete